MDFIELGYIGLFVACFLSATIIPFASEGVVAYFVIDGFDPFTILIIATLANSMGSVTNYLLGTISSPQKITARLSSPQKFERFAIRIKNYGFWLAALSWVPVVGDPLTVLLGFFRVQFFPFLLLVIITKGLRYLLLIYLLA